MADRLFVAVIGSRNSGKSTTWNRLFGGTVKTGKWARTLSLGGGRSTEVFLISGSHEERERYAADVLKNVDCQIVLCSVQYVEEAIERTWSHIFEEGFAIYADGTDVCSWDYARQAGFTRPRKPVYQDLSDQAGWPEIHVASGTVAMVA